MHGQGNRRYKTNRNRSRTPPRRRRSSDRARSRSGSKSRSRHGPRYNPHQRYENSSRPGCSQGRYRSSLRNSRTLKSSMWKVSNSGGVHMLPYLGSSALMERRKHEHELLKTKLVLQEKENEILQLKLDCKQKEGSSMELHLHDQSSASPNNSATDRRIERPIQASAAEDDEISLAESNAGVSQSDITEFHESVHSVALKAGSETTATISAVDRIEDISVVSSAPSPSVSDMTSFSMFPKQKSTPIPTSPIKLTAEINAVPMEVAPTATISAVVKSKSATISADSAPLINKSATISADSKKNLKPANITAGSSVSKKQTSVGATSVDGDKESTAARTSAVSETVQKSATFNADSGNLFEIFDVESDSECESEITKKKSVKDKVKEKKRPDSCRKSVPQKKSKKDNQKKKKKSHIDKTIADIAKHVDYAESSDEDEIVDIVSITLPVSKDATEPSIDDGGFVAALDAQKPGIVATKKRTQTSCTLAEPEKRPNKGNVIVLGPVPGLTVRGRPGYEAALVVENLCNPDGVEISFIHCTESGKWTKTANSLTTQGLAKLCQRTSWYQLASNIKIVSGRAIKDNTFPPNLPIEFE